MVKLRKKPAGATTPTAISAATDRKIKQPSIETRTRILTTGLELFSTLGFDATGTKQIADKAGVPIGLIFYYFKTKEALLDTILLQQSLVAAVTEAFDSSCMRLDGSDQGALNSLTAATRQLLGWLSNNRQWALLFFRELTLDRKITARLRQERKTALGILGQWLVKLSEMGPCRINDPESAAQLLASGLLVGALVDRPKDLDAFAKRASSTILRATTAR